MPIDTLSPSFLPGLLIVFKIGILLVSILYFLFSLIVLRQVNLMTDTLITEVSPLLRFFAILHSGFALGIVVIFFGLFFGLA